MIYYKLYITQFISIDFNDKSFNNCIIKSAVFSIFILTIIFRVNDQYII